jgi:hypothetical protein
MDDVTIPALMLIAANLCVLAICWSQQRAIVRLERRAADLAEAVLSLPDPPHERPAAAAPQPPLPGRSATAVALTPGPRASPPSDQAPDRGGQPLTGRE